MKLHTCFITYNRLDLTKQAISSYLETVTLPYTYVVVDNASSDGTREWLGEQGHPAILLPENRYPGYACNAGWAAAPADATLLHRADNDFRFLPGWCEQVEHKFQTQKVGQLGLRTADEELHAKTNVGGNCVIRRRLWDEGLRYDERTWPEIAEQVGPGHSEDSILSPIVREMGYRWTRVNAPCIVPLSAGSWADPYYQRSYGDRGIEPHPDDPTYVK